MDIKYTATKDNQKIEIEFKQINSEELEKSLFERIMKLIDNKDNQLYRTDLSKYVSDTFKQAWKDGMDKALSEKANKN